MPRNTPKTTAKSSAMKQQRREEAQRKARKAQMIAIIGGVALVAIIAVVLLISANRPEAPVGSFVTVPTQTWPEEDGKTLGSPIATVVLKEFADFQCPVCKSFNESVQEQIINDYVKTGKVRYEFHHLIIIDGNVGGQESRQAAEANECANEQGRFWDYHEMLFANQGGEGSGALSDERLKAFAGAIGLDKEKFNACFDSNRFATNVTADDALGRSIGLRGTPSLLVNGKLVENPMDYNGVKAVIDAALGGQ